MAFTRDLRVPMIARAMNTRPDERLSFLDLARQGARVERRLVPEELPRLSSIARVLRPVDVVLEFARDEAGRVRVTGSVEARVQAVCQRCVEDVERSISARIDLAIVSEHEARQLGGALDVHTADGMSVSCAELVEDELIMALPERLCREEPCEYAPHLFYPALEAREEQENAAGGDSRENPFSVLAALKGQADS